MKVLRLSTQLHKWVALVIGLQVLFWVSGGVVMSVIPIEQVRSEHHLAEVKPAPLPMNAVLPLSEAAARAGVAPVEAQLKTTPRGPVWVFKTAKDVSVAVSATTGRPLEGLTAIEAKRLAQSAYKGEGRATSAELLPTAPEETGKSGPLWRVGFDDAEGTDFYLAPDTAEVVSRRSDVWRFYDFFWRLHIMDWEKGADFNHPLIIISAVVTLVVVMTGFILLWIRVGRDLAAWVPRLAALRSGDKIAR